MYLIWQSKVKRKLEQISGMPDQSWCLVHILGVSMMLNSTHQALQRKSSSLWKLSEEKIRISGEQWCCSHMGTRVIYIYHIFVSGFLDMTCKCILYSCGSQWYAACSCLIRTASLSWNYDYCPGGHLKYLRAPEKAPRFTKSLLLVFCHEQLLWFLKQNRNNVSVSKAYDGINLPFFQWTWFLGTHTMLFREQTAFSELSRRLAQWFLISMTSRYSLDSFEKFIIAVLVESHPQNKNTY